MKIYISSNIKLHKPFFKKTGARSFILERGTDAYEVFIAYHIFNSKLDFNAIYMTDNQTVKNNV